MSKSVYWWDYKALAAALRDNAVTARAMRFYGVVFAIIIALSIIPNFFEIANEGTAYGVISNLFFFSMLFGIPYFINRRGDGKDFMKRLVSLSLPILMRVYVWGALLSLIIAVFYGVIGLTAAMQGENPSPLIAAFSGNTSKGIATMGIVLVWLLLMIYSLVAYIKGFKIASRPASQG